MALSDDVFREYLRQQKPGKEEKEEQEPSWKDKPQYALAKEQAEQ